MDLKAILLLNKPLSIFIYGAVFTIIALVALMIFSASGGRTTARRVNTPQAEHTEKKVSDLPDGMKDKV